MLKENEKEHFTNDNPKSDITSESKKLRKNHVWHKIPWLKALYQIDGTCQY